MTRMIRPLALLAALAGTLIACAGAEKPGAPQARAAPTGAAQPVKRPDVTDVAVRVFGLACLRPGENEALRREWLGGNRFGRVTAARAGLPENSPGEVWLSPDPALPVAVTTGVRDIQCQVSAASGDPDKAASNFAGLMQGIAQGGVPARKDQDARMAPGGDPGRFLSYRIGAQAADGPGFWAVLSARQPAEGRVALLMTFSRALPGAVW